MPTESVPIKVVAKVRPFVEDGQGKKIIKTSGDKIIIEGGGKEQTFTCDYTYGTKGKASDIYQDTCAGLIQRALLGYNVTLITLGTTGSGKTRLLSGSEDELGLVPWIIRGLYSCINEVRGKKIVFVTVSFVEILDEELTDMLNPHPNQMKIREHPHLDIYVDGLSEMVANSEDDLLRLYTQGNRARKMGADDVHAHRERSTGIFYINVEQKENGSSKVGLRSTITVADIAGIERDHGAKNIVNVVNALKSGGSMPYRDSKVTRLLQESLGGNAMTLALITLSPADKCYQESLQCLQLAQSIRGIKNKVKVNLDETQGLISDLREEIARLRNQITKRKDFNKEEVMKMEGLVRDLQIAKKQTWEEKERMSVKYEEERKTNLANKGILEWVMDSTKRGNKEIEERIIILQKEKDQLTLEYKDKRKKVDDMKDELQKKIADYSKLAEKGKVNESDTKKRVTAIHELKEKLKRETDVLKDLKKKLKDVQDKQKTEKESAQGVSMVKGNAQLRYMVEAEDRRRQETENKALISEELERMKLETEHEKAEIQMRSAQGKTCTSEEGAKMECEVVDLRAERSVVTLQIQTLQQEKEHLQHDLDLAFKHHKDELEIQQLQHFQTFRQYREQFEQQKALLDQRYRKLLEDAVQDAIYLSSRNNELMLEHQAQQQEIAELKDKLTAAESKHPSSKK